MKNDELNKIYKQALHDRNELMKKYDKIEDKNIDNVLTIFEKQIEFEGLFIFVKVGIVKCYLYEENGIAKIGDKFTIDNGKYVQDCVAAESPI